MPDMRANVTKRAAMLDFDLESAMSIPQVAKALSVSEASVRNWIKAGYLLLAQGAGVTRQSFENFRTNVAGKEKLTKRANKSLLDHHDHVDLVEKITASLGDDKDFVKVGDEYQSSLSNAYRNKEGIYYTPEYICEAMFSDAPPAKSNYTFCDPCCGSGNFIVSAIRHGFLPENIYGYDTDSTAVEITKRRILEETGYKTSNIICGDFLDVEKNILFDMIITNPPWGKKISKSEKEIYAALYGASRSLDTSSLFFFASMKILKSGGFLSFLLPESFFKIATFYNVRSELLRYSVCSIRDFGKPFKGLLTRAQSVSLYKTADISGQVSCVTKDSTFDRTQSTFLENPTKIINFESCPQDALVISRLFSKPYLTLEGNARWGLGIVTGNNKKFCHDQPSDGLIPVYKGVDIHKNYLNTPTTFVPNNLSLYQQVAPIEMFEASEKILYRFISSNLIFYHDKDKAYCLNSANMLVLADSFPISTADLVSLFNTELFNWVFSKLFNTHKILRSDLEKLPIPIDFFAQNKSLSEEALLEYYDIERDENGAFKVKE